MNVIQINQTCAFAAKHYKYNPVDARRRVSTGKVIYLDWWEKDKAKIVFSGSQKQAKD